MKDLVLTLHIA